MLSNCHAQELKNWSYASTALYTMGPPNFTLNTIHSVSNVWQACISTTSITWFCSVIYRSKKLLSLLQVLFLIIFIPLISALVLIGLKTAVSISLDLIFWEKRSSVLEIPDKTSSVALMDLSCPNGSLYLIQSMNSILERDVIYFYYYYLLEIEN